MGVINHQRSHHWGGTTSDSFCPDHRIDRLQALPPVPHGASAMAWKRLGFSPESYDFN